MINQTIDGISVKLNQVFGDEVRIYSEDIKQGLTEPCFFIMVLNPSHEQGLGVKGIRRQPFDIHYFPSVVGSNLELQTMATNLYEAVDMITVGEGLVRGTQMSHRVVDGVLHFFVSYNMHVTQATTAEDAMEELTHDSSLKG